MTQTGGGSNGRDRLTRTGPGPAVVRQHTVPPRSPNVPQPKGGKRRRQQRPAQRSAGVRLGRALARGLVAIGFVALVCLGAIYLRLLHGPLPVSFLAEPAVRAVNAELPGLAVAIDDAVLQLGARGQFEVHLRGVNVTDGADRTIATADTAGIQISAGSLLRGRVAAQRITLIEPRFRLAYGADGKLIFTVASAAGDQEPQRAGSTAVATPAAAAPAHTAEQSHRTNSAGPAETGSDVMGVVASLIAHLRRDGETAALQAVTFKTALFEIAGPSGNDVWKIDDLAIDLSHRQKRSVVTAAATIVSGGQPWTIDVRAEEAEKAQTLKLAFAVDGLVPRNIARELPAFAAFSGLDVPLTGTASATLDKSAGLHHVTVQTTLGKGNVYLAGLNGVPLAVDRGSLTVRKTGNAFELDRIAIESGANRLEFGGRVEGDSASGFSFDLRSLSGSLAPPQGAEPIPIEALVLRGKTAPRSGHVEVEQVALKIAGAEIAASGRMAGTTQFEGRISPMALSTLKTIWPEALAPRSRAFVMERVTKGELKGGAFKIHAGDIDPAVRSTGERQQSLTLEAADIEVQLRKELPPVELPRALLRLEGDSVELSAPDLHMTAGANRRLSCKTARLTAVDIDKPRPLAELSARCQSGVQALADILDREPISLLKSNNVTIPIANIDGKLEGQLKATLPLIDAISSADVRYEGKARITDGRIKDVFAHHDINGATINIAATEKSVDIRGDMLFAGIAAKLAGSWQPGATDSKQSPVRLTARLDNADRNLLGLDLDNLVQGDVPIEISVQRGKADEPTLHVSGDLTSAELTLDELHWRKPAGRPARIDFDVGKGRQGKGLELQNFKVSGETIAIDGWVSIGPDNRAREYYFPEFSLNVVSNLEVQGVLRPDRVWEVKAQGKTFDGRDFFRSLYAFGNDRPKPRKDRPGLEIHAKIDNVLGAHETTLRQVDLRFAKRAEQVSGLEMKGMMEGAVPLTAMLKPDQSRQRVVAIDTNDAGQALKLIGFYPNMAGGKGQLEVNLEGRGAVEKAGRLKIKGFRILGDAILSEVFQGADDSTVQDSRPAISAGTPRRRVVREQLEFESLDATFSVGNAQVVIDEADARGPLVGATLRGKLDFKAQRMDLGGTYVPLSGLNRVVGQIPILSPILTGPRGEGVLGIPFAITGPMAQPQVIFNPIGLGAPGFLRELFQMGPQNPRVTPRVEAPPKPGAPKVNSSPPEVRRGAEPGQRPAGEVIDGWSSSTTPPAPTGKR